jgi:hypothetical protein
MMKIELMLVLLDLTMLFPNYNWVTPRYLAIDQGTTDDRKL